MSTPSTLQRAARALRHRARVQMARIRPQKSRDEIHSYWQAPDAGDAGNQPEHYLDPEEGTARSDYVIGLARPYLTEESAVLEVGCNVGRNLNQFFQAGYRNVNGIEISARAVESLRKAYPDMAAAAGIHEGKAEEVLPTLPDDGFDVVFTVAVLVHMHPDSEGVLFPHISRVARNAIVVIEDEQDELSPRHFKRNYRQVFEPLGWRQVHEEPAGPLNIGLPDAYIARVFVPA